ncbi:MAG: DegT/DnrJ/EryC1/StrS family aminotransferase [Lachnospiraceae bacterium]|nr:DegT/DnrJ/EryC1/StrS family aminotransferase [Lachnospiraceae bacterium]
MINPGRLDRGYEKYASEYEEKALEVLRSGWYVLGKEVEAFEKEFASYIGSRYSAGVANGLDALSLAFRALGIGEGDEVIVQANTYIASVMGITMNGATPVFVEPDEYFGIDPKEVEAAVTERTKAVLAVHLYGLSCDMEKITGICKKHGLKLVEDCAQSHGSKFNGQMTGTFADIGCFSFYPSKNLGCFGDGGAVVTDNEEYLKKIKMLRNYGSAKRYYNDEVGVNSRLDELQAGLLRVKLGHLDELNEERDRIAKAYLEGIKNPAVTLPRIREGCNHTWHQFVIRCGTRDELMEYLKKKEIGTIIHYPVPPHLQKAYGCLNKKKGDFPISEAMADEVLSLPMYNGMTGEEIKTVIDAINSFKGA